MRPVSTPSEPPCVEKMHFEDVYGTRDASSWMLSVPAAVEEGAIDGIRMWTTLGLRLTSCDVALPLASTDTAKVLPFALTLHATELPDGKPAAFANSSVLGRSEPIARAHHAEDVEAGLGSSLQRRLAVAANRS